MIDYYDLEFKDDGLAYYNDKPYSGKAKDSYRSGKRLCTYIFISGSLVYEY